MPPYVGRCDYAANGGDTLIYASIGGPTLYVWACCQGQESGPASPEDGGDFGHQAPTASQAASAKTTFVNYAKTATGIVYPGSLSDFRTSPTSANQTYLLGEKVAGPTTTIRTQPPSAPTTADNEFSMMGDNEDLCRWTDTMALEDRPGFFPAACSACAPRRLPDGLLRRFRQVDELQPDPTIHKYLGNRKDGHPIDAKKL